MNGWFFMTGKGELSIFGNGKAAADFGVEKWVGACTDSIKNKGYFTAALSGGKTPIDFYKILSAGGKELPWAKIHLFLADERFVPATDEESNYRLVRECLLNHVNIPKNNVHRIDTEGVSIEMAALKYEKEIRDFFNIKDDRIPEFDLILLGIGEDGHTASLFPGAPSLKEEKRVAIPIIAEKPPYKRISLTLPVLTNAQRIMFLVTGSEKAGIVREIVEESESRLPAFLVRRRAKNVHLIIDEDTASLLTVSKGAR
jgi:6-phosphogluconolactonase